MKKGLPLQTNLSIKNGLLVFMIFIIAFKVQSQPIVQNNVLIEWPNASGSIIIPNTVYSIDKKVFYKNNNIISVVIPNTVKQINEYAFAECSNLKSLKFNGQADGIDELISIDETAFGGCNGIKDLSINRNFSYYFDSSPFKNLLGLDSLFIGNQVNELGAWAFSGCSQLSKICIDGDSTKKNNAINIYESSFYGGKISFLSFNRNIFVTSYSLSSPFKDVETIEIGNSVSVLGSGLFGGCENLKSIVIPNSVDTIEYNVFSYCTNLEKITLGNNVKAIGSGAFLECSSLKNIVLPNSLKEIERVLFEDCIKLESIILGDEVSKIGDGAFINCKSLIGINFPVTLDSIGVNSFLNCTGLKSLDLSNLPSLTSIGEDAFMNCFGLTSIKFSNYLKTIQREAFVNCTGLSSLKIPNSITSIGLNAFENCTGLEELIIGDEEGTLPSEEITFVFNVFAGCNNISTAVINRNMSDVFAPAIFLDTKLTSVTISNKVTALSSYLFFGCSLLETIKIPESVNRIGDGAFRACTSLKSINLPQNIQYIGQETFSECSSLTEIDIPEQVTEIQYSAFSVCPNLQSVKIPKSVISISKLAFSWSQNLKELIVYNPVPIEVESPCFNYYFPSATCVLYVPKGSKSAYQQAPEWRYFENIVEMEGTGIENPHITPDDFSINQLNGNLFIQIFSEMSMPLAIYDMTGKLMYSTFVIKSTEIPIHNFTSGVYVIKIGNTSHKIFIK